MSAGHLYHAFGNCCIMCGVGLMESDECDLRTAKCPGGPDTNVVSIAHIIAERKLARQLHFDRPFKYPPA